MRKLFSFHMVSVDGFLAGTGGTIDWHNVDEEFHAFAIEHACDVDLLLFGRLTNELLASYWPTASEGVDWNNARLIAANVVEEVIQLKRQPGKDIALFSSANAQSSLMELDLIDEYRLMINPVVLGRGLPLFKGRSDKLDLKLVDTRVFRSGNVLLSYQPVSASLV